MMTYVKVVIILAALATRLHCFGLSCISQIDFSENQTECPIYDLKNCKDPSTPPSCPLLEVKYKYPCERFICKDEKENLVSPEKMMILASQSDTTTPNPVKMEELISTLKDQLAKVKDHLKAAPLRMKEFLHGPTEESHEFAMMLLTLFAFLLFMLFMSLCMGYCVNRCVGDNSDDPETNNSTNPDQCRIQASNPDSGPDGNLASSQCGRLASTNNDYAVIEEPDVSLPSSSTPTPLNPLKQKSITEFFKMAVRSSAGGNVGNEAVEEPNDDGDLVEIDINDCNHWRTELTKELDDSDEEDPDYRASHTEIFIPQVHRRSERKCKPLDPLDL